jgi:hypothetical protein
MSERVLRLGDVLVQLLAQLLDHLSPLEDVTPLLFEVENILKVLRVIRSAKVPYMTSSAEVMKSLAGPSSGIVGCDGIGPPWMTDRSSLAALAVGGGISCAPEAYASLAAGVGGSVAA